MPKRRMLVLDEKNSPWPVFLKEFFEDTPSEITVTGDAATAGNWTVPGGDGAFVDPGRLSRPLVQKLKLLAQTRPGFFLFRLGASHPNSGGLTFSDAFGGPGGLIEFQKKLVMHLPMPDPVRVLVADDEPAVGEMIRDYLDKRVRPGYEVRCAGNGGEGLAEIRKQRPHVLVLDLKMPVMEGREVYRRIRTEMPDLPVIVFFDAVYGDEIAEIYRFGRPAVVEKGSRQSAVPELTDLIKKMVFFG